MATSLLIICFVAVGCVVAYPLGKIGENEPFSVESLPTDFGSYDTNANGYIDLEELAKTAGITVDDTRKPFMDADIDDDNQISPEEFEKAPWSFKFSNELFLREEEDDDNTKGLETELTTLYDSSEDMSIDLGEKTLGSDEENGPVTLETIEETPTPELIDDISDMPREEEFDQDSEYEVEEEPIEEKDDESQNLDNDKEEDESDDEEEDDDVIDPLYNEDDQLRKQDDFVSEEEFVENAIY